MDYEMQKLNRQSRRKLTEDLSLAAVSKLCNEQSLANPSLALFCLVLERFDTSRFATCRFGVANLQVTNWQVSNGPGTVLFSTPGATDFQPYPEEITRIWSFFQNALVQRALSCSEHSRAASTHSSVTKLLHIFANQILVKLDVIVFFYPIMT